MRILLSIAITAAFLFLSLNSLFAIEIFPKEVQLRGSDENSRILVSYIDPKGDRVEVTRDAAFASSDGSVIKVDALGQVTAVADGKATIEVTYRGETQKAVVHVVGCNRVISPDFETDVQAILASVGCSAGACHGKQGGQNGFQLSLLGFDSDFDHASITKHARGRRISHSTPTESLLLKKATAEVPHGGGRKLEVGDPHYRRLLRWIEGGAPRETKDSTSLTSIRLWPPELVMKPNSKHRVVVLAEFSDGSRRDVTHLTAFSSNESAVASVKEATITAGPIPGEATIMARFLDQITTCGVLIPRVDSVPDEHYKQLPRNNFIDDLVWQKLQRLRITPSSAAGDDRFLRRAYVDIIGRVPSADEAKSFLDDPATDKKLRLVNSLLEHPGYADHWANKWADLLRPNPYRVGIKNVMAFDNWIRQSFRENRPYDEFVRELLTAQGSSWRNGAPVLFRDRRSPDELTTMVSQLFLGVRLECAKCHHHPFEVWGQDDFYSFAAYFAKVKRKGTGLSPPISGGEEIFFTAHSGKVIHPRTGESMPARPLGGKAIELAKLQQPRVTLVDWMTDDGNPYFSHVIANRVWAEMMGRGLVEPVDDFRATNPPSNQPLMDALAKHLRDHDYDLKALIRVIATSYVYGLKSEPNDTNKADHRNYSRHYRTRLRAEVLLDAVNDITGANEKLDAMPAGSRSNQVWTHRVPSLFLDTFGRPDRNQDPPCERTTDTAVVQALHLMNSPRLHKKVTDDKGIAAKLAASTADVDEVVRRLYLSVYARYPADKEAEIARQWFAREGKSRRGSTEDLMWAMLNSAEFVFED